METPARQASTARSVEESPPAGSAGPDGETPGHTTPGVERTPSKLSLRDLAALAGARQAEAEAHSRQDGPGSDALHLPGGSGSGVAGGPTTRGGAVSRPAAGLRGNESFFRSGWGVLPGEGVERHLHVHLTLTQPLYSRLVRGAARGVWCCGCGAFLGRPCFERAR